MYRINYTYTHISTATTTQIVAKSFVRVIVNTTAAGTITLTDKTATVTTSVIGIMKASIVENVYDYGILLVSGGLEVITGAASDITVVTSKTSI